MIKTKKLIHRDIEPLREGTSFDLLMPELSFQHQEMFIMDFTSRRCKVCSTDQLTKNRLAFREKSCTKSKEPHCDAVLIYTEPYLYAIKNLKIKHCVSGLSIRVCIVFRNRGTSLIVLLWKNV